MRLSVFIGKNSVAAAASDDCTHGVEHIDHAKRNNDHNNGEDRYPLGQETFCENIRKRTENAVFPMEEITEVFPEFPRYSAAAGEDGKIGYYERDAGNGSAQNTTESKFCFPTGNIFFRQDPETDSIGESSNQRIFYL